MWQRLMMHRYARLIRLDKPAGIWLLMLPCWWGALAHSEGLPLSALILFAMGAFAMRSAGCIMNDMADRELDAQVSRTATRPLASGEVLSYEALGILALLLLMGLGVAMAFGTNVVLLGLAWLPLIALYPYMKRITFWPQAFLGITFGAGSLFASMAMTGAISLSASMLYLASIAWVVGYDTIYACQDRDDDESVGIKSTARLFGEQVQRFVGGCYAVFLLFILIGWLLQPSGAHVWQVIPVILSAIMLFRQWRLFDPKKIERCGELFRSNVSIGLLVCLLFV